MSSGSPPHSTPHDASHFSKTRCDPNTPSTSYHIPPPKASYLDAAEEQPTFLKSSTYGQISYEVDDTNSSFNYSYNPQREPLRATSSSKYLEDTSYSGHGMLEAAPEYLLVNAPASVPPSFSYLSDRQESGHLSVQSPRDDARFSTPECAPDSVLISAPTSSEAHYIPSPTGESESSVLTINDSDQTAAIIGKDAKKATLKNVESIRYESPKNYDQSCMLNAFHPGSEEINSADDVEMKDSSNGEDVAQIDTDESDGRVSMVDRLFAMLQRAERESNELVTNDAIIESQERTSRMSQATPAFSLAQPSSSQQAHYPPQVPQFRTVSQDENIQNIAVAMPHCPQRDNVSTAYATNSFPAYTAGNRPFLSTMAVPPLPQYQSQYVMHQYSRDGEHAQSLERNQLVYNQNPTYVVPHVQLQQQEPPHQYFQPVMTEPVHQAPYKDYPAMQFFNPSYSQVWNATSYEESTMSTLPQLIPQIETEPFHHLDPEEDVDVEPAEYEEKSTESTPTDSESETDIDVFDSISARQSSDHEQTDEVHEEPQLKGPPFEQKGPTRTKEIQPVPPPPPPSPMDVNRTKPIDGMDRKSIIEQLTHSMDRLEDISIQKVADYDREQELKDLCEKMNSRFQKLYPNLLLQNDDDEIGPNVMDEEVIDGDPEDGYVMRNSAQLATKYLALWFPDKKERDRMITWNTYRKVKPIRLCFLDNRIGHGEFENFNIGEFVSVTGHMMFTYGDGPEALDETRLFVLDVVRQQMNMLLRRVWCNIVQTHQRRVITYTNIFDLYKNHPIRLRRLVRYLIEQHRTRHMLYRVMVDQGRRRGQYYIENRMGVDETGATEVIFLRKRAPHIYKALSASYEDQLEFLCEERRLQDCDPDLANIKMFLKHRNRHLSGEHKELLNFARRVSYCSRTGRLSAFRAHRFHEFLGFPDLQTDLIYVLDFMAREIVMEVTYHAALIREQERQSIPTPTSGFLHQPLSKSKLAAESMELRHYEDGLRTMLGWRQKEDILFGEDERKVMFSYGKNPRKWESDKEYNQREAAEHREFDSITPMSRHSVRFTSAELYEEHKKILRGEYWDSCPEDLTKEAFVIANTYAASRLAQASVAQPELPEKWKEQYQQGIKEEKERLDKLRALKHEGDRYKRLTAQLVHMMEKNTIDDSDTVLNTDKTIHEAILRHENLNKAQL